MKMISNLLDTLTLGSDEHRIGGTIRKIYFGIFYNTTFIVNLTFTLGGVSAYLGLLLSQDSLTTNKVLAPLGIGLLSAYFYNLIYIVNDIVDWQKDKKNSAAKFTGRHVLGKDYLYWLIGGYSLVLGILADLSEHRLFILFLTYALVLISLSLIHSYFYKTKIITIFLERWLKLCSPFLIYFFVTSSDIVPILASLMLIFPLSFDFDYSLRGYLKKLGLRMDLRYTTYGLYWLLVGGTCLISGIFVKDYSRILAYATIYFSIVALTHLMSRKLPFSFLHNRYKKEVALQKERLLTYGLLQVFVIILSIVYAAVH